MSQEGGAPKIPKIEDLAITSASKEDSEVTAAPSKNDSEVTAASKEDLKLSGRNVTIKTKDNQTYAFPVEMSEHLGLIKTMMSKDTNEVDSDGSDDEDDDSNTDIIPLPNVESKYFKEILKFLEILLTNELPKIQKPLIDSDMAKVLGENGKVYADYVSSYDTDTIFEIISASNYLDCKPLLNLMCAKVASEIKGKTPEEIRTKFNIENDFSPEEEAKIREENKWVEEATN